LLQLEDNDDDDISGDSGTEVPRRNSRHVNISKHLGKSSNNNALIRSTTVMSNNVLSNASQTTSFSQSRYTP
jgi:hypothetical protein